LSQAVVRYQAFVVSLTSTAILNGAILFFLDDVCLNDEVSDTRGDAIKYFCRPKNKKEEFLL
jgi:hypothetical protein